MNRTKSIFAIALATALLITGCGGTTAKKGNKTTVTQSQHAESRRVIAKLYDYDIVAEYPHSTGSYTQGLQYVDGVMWEVKGR